MFQPIFWSYPRDIGKLCPGLNFLINIVYWEILRVFFFPRIGEIFCATMRKFVDDFLSIRGIDTFFFLDLGTRIFTWTLEEENFLIEFPSYFRGFSLFLHAYNGNNVTELQLVSVGFQFGSFLIDKVYIFN